MKKRVTAIIAAAMLACACGAMADAIPSVRLAQIHESAPAYWDGAYTAHGRQITFHAPVYVPDAQQMPVLEVTGVGAADMRMPQDKMLEIGAPGFVYVSRKATLDKLYWWESGKYALWSQEGQARAMESHAPNNTVSLSDAVGDMQAICDALFGPGVYGVMAERARVLAPIQINGKYHDFSDMTGWQHYTGKGVYHLYAHLTLRGVPVIMGAGYGCVAPGEQEPCAMLSGPSLLSVGHYLGGGEYADVSARWLFRETGVIAQDVPLCTFDEVRREIERLIEVGRIRDVFSVRLGYVVYKKEGMAYPKDARQAQGARYAAVPTWVVECTYASGAGAELEPAPKEPTPYYKAEGYICLMINAQTGKAVDPCETAASHERYEAVLTAPQVTLWQ